MKVFNRPILQAPLSWVQIYVGLGWAGFLPGYAGAGGTLGWLLGLILAVTGVWGFFGCFRGSKGNASRQTAAAPAPQKMTDEELTEVKNILRQGDDMPALIFVRLKTGVSLKAAKGIVESIKQGL